MSASLSDVAHDVVKMGKTLTVGEGCWTRHQRLTEVTVILPKALPVVRRGSSAEAHRRNRPLLPQLLQLVRLSLEVG